MCRATVRLQKLSVSNRNRQLLICVESISLFSLERGGLPTDRPAKPLRLDDVEGIGPGDRELVHILHHQRQQFCAALDLDGLCNRFLIVGQDRKQRILRAGNRHVRIIRQCIRIDQQHTILHAEHVLFAHVRQDHVHGEVAVSQRLLVHDNGHIVKQHGRGESFDHVAGRLGGGGKIGVSMAQLLRGAVCWLLGVSFTVFLGAMSLQGVTSASIDGVAIRAAKYAVDNFVPVVGGMFSDTMDTLVGCTLIVKNALGVAAVLVLVGALVGPLLRTLAVVFMLRLSAALLEPIADGDIVCAIGDFSRTVVLFFITMLCVGTMYFLLIVQVLLVGNLTVLLR